MSNIYWLQLLTCKHCWWFSETSNLIPFTDQTIKNIISRLFNNGKKCSLTWYLFFTEWNVGVTDDNCSYYLVLLFVALFDSKWCVCVCRYLTHSPPSLFQVTEAKGLGWQMVGTVTCASADFFVARPQLMLMDITELGTIKLQLEVTWKYGRTPSTHK